jgi:hypothetical protein
MFLLQLIHANTHKNTEIVTVVGGKKAQIKSVRRLLLAVAQYAVYVHCFCKLRFEMVISCLSKNERDCVRVLLWLWLLLLNSHFRLTDNNLHSHGMNNTIEKNTKKRKSRQSDGEKFKEWLNAKRKAGLGIRQILHELGLPTELVRS